MMRKSKIFFFCLGGSIILAVAATRIIEINRGVPKSFAITTYHLNDVVSLNDLELTVLNYSKGKSYHYDGGNPMDQYEFMPVTVTVNVKNISPDAQDLAILKESRLFSGYNYYNTGDVDFPQQVLDPQQQTTLTYVYTVDAEKVEESFQFVLTTQALLRFDQANYHASYDKGVYKGVAIQL
ncbi:hypothetical protein IGJ19_001021 [Enterococcus sp. DIV1368b]